MKKYSLLTKILCVYGIIFIINYMSAIFLNFSCPVIFLIGVILFFIILPIKSAIKECKHNKGSAIAMLICYLLVWLMAIAVFTPGYFGALKTAKSNQCVSNLKRIREAKLKWAIDTDAAKETTPVWEDLIPKYLETKPICPAGGSYIIGDIELDSLPLCSIGNNNTPERTYDDHNILK